MQILIKGHTKMNYQITLSIITMEKSRVHIPRNFHKILQNNGPFILPIIVKCVAQCELDSLIYYYIKCFKTKLWECTCIIAPSGVTRLSPLQ